MTASFLSTFATPSTWLWFAVIWSSSLLTTSYYHPAGIRSRTTFFHRKTRHNLAAADFWTRFPSSTSSSPSTYSTSPSKLFAKKIWTPPSSSSPSPSLPLSRNQQEKEGEQEEDVEGDKGLAFTVELTKKRAGISWGSDLSFRWIYVLDLEPTGEAAESGLIQKGDYIIGVGNTSTIAMDFDFVLSTLNKAQETRLNYTFFRGSKEQLLGGKVPEPSEMTVTVTVLQQGKPDVILKCPGGTNLRQLLVGNGINVYRSLTRWTNCSGKQRCGTCIVDVQKGADQCTRRALDEEATLRENPESYRLSCVTTVYGDCTIEVQGPVGASQWTR